MPYVREHVRLSPPIAYHGPTKVPRASVGPIDMSDRIGLGYNISVSEGEHERDIIKYLESEGYRVFGHAVSTDELVKLRNFLKTEYVQIHIYTPKNYDSLLESSKRRLLFMEPAKRHMIMSMEE